MKSDPIMEELFRVKYAISAENDNDVRKVVTAIRAYNLANPPPHTPSRRKLIEGHPVGRSVFRDDEILSELRTVKERLSAEMAGRKHSSPLASPPKNLRNKRKHGSFRIGTGAVANKRDGKH